MFLVASFDTFFAALKIQFGHRTRDEPMIDFRLTCKIDETIL